MILVLFQLLKTKQAFTFTFLPNKNTSILLHRNFCMIIHFLTARTRTFLDIGSQSSWCLHMINILLLSRLSMHLVWLLKSKRNFSTITKLKHPVDLTWNAPSHFLLNGFGNKSSPKTKAFLFFLLICWKLFARSVSSLSSTFHTV